MKPTTVTICDENIPRPALFTETAALTNALLEHYSDVWSEVAADGAMPPTWEAIRLELERRDLLRDRHIAHIHQHEPVAGR